MFGQMVVPSLDKFKSVVVDILGRSMGHGTFMERYERKLIPLVGWDVENAVADPTDDRTGLLERSGEE